jgi:hypothetical protein
LSDLLLGYGFTEVKAELWARFIEAALSVLNEAADELRSPVAWAAFGQKRGALGAPRTRRRQKVVERAPIEDALTAELGHIARRIRAALPAGHFLRLHEVAFEAEHLIESATRTGRHSRKVDFLIYAQAGLDPPELAIEAKPLLTPHDIVNRYLGEEGIGCFFTADSTYSTHPVAAMLAYTVDAAGRGFGSDIRSAVAGYTPQPLSLDDALLTTGVAVVCSRHDRAHLALEPVAIMHFELIFQPETMPTD